MLGPEGAQGLLLSFALASAHVAPFLGPSLLGCYLLLLLAETKGEARGDRACGIDPCTLLSRWSAVPCSYTDHVLKLATICRRR